MSNSYIPWRTTDDRSTMFRDQNLAEQNCLSSQLLSETQYIHLICDWDKLYRWLSGQLIFILSSEPLCTGHSCSAQSTESVSTTNQLALCSPCASLARRAASFVGATEVCGSLKMSWRTVAIRLARLSKDSSVLLNAAVVEKTSNCKFDVSFLVLQIQLAPFYSMQLKRLKVRADI